VSVPCLPRVIRRVGLPRPPARPVLGEINPVARARTFDAEASKACVPEIGVLLARLERVNAALGDFRGRHDSASRAC
jgi:hypothetical protein